MSAEKRRCLLCYSPKDIDGRDALLSHLAAVRGALIVWSIDSVLAGERTNEEFQLAAVGADIALLLLSADFIAEHDQEPLALQVKLLRQLQAQRGLLLIPLLWRHCAWQAIDWLADLNPLPIEGTAFRAMDQAWRDRALAELALQLDAQSRYYVGSPRTSWATPGLWVSGIIVSLTLIIYCLRGTSLGSFGSSTTEQNIDSSALRSSKPMNLLKTWSVGGIVKDTNHQPLAGVAISAPQLSATTLTNDQGTFRLLLRNENNSLILLRAECAMPIAKRRYRPLDVHVTAGATNLSLIMEEER